MVQDFIPLDKSWTIRMGVLDMLYGQDQIFRFLEKEKELSDDLTALSRAIHSWNEGGVVDVGESGTLYRFLQFASWKFDLRKELVRRGTLEARKMTQNPDIVHSPLRDLLLLDNGTSQWASAAVLCGNRETLENPPYKLALTHEAVREWNSAKKKGTAWQPRYDTTILRQAETFLSLLRGEASHFSPEQSEDYCFARAFGYMTKEEGEKRWPSLRGHESDRITEMETSLRALEAKEEVISRDHRVVQAIAMYAKLKKQDVHIRYPASVGKSWPQFWRFLENADRLALL